MQKSTTSKALSLLLTLLVSLGTFASACVGVLATAKIVSPKVYAQQIDSYEINFATGGTTSTANGITANAELGKRIYPHPGFKSISVTVEYTGNATDAGIMTIELSGNSANQGFFSIEDSFYVPQGFIANKKNTNLSYFHLRISDLGDISDLTLSMSYADTTWYALTTPAPKTIQGSIAEVIFDLVTPFADEGTTVDVQYEINGIDADNDGDPDAMAEGKYSVTLSSIKANYYETDTMTVVHGAHGKYSYITGIGSGLGSFTVPAEDVDDFVFSVTFKQGGDSTINLSSGKSSGSGGGGGSFTFSSALNPANQPVDQALASQLAANALKASKQNYADITLIGNSISLDIMKSLAKQAEDSHKNLFVKSNTRDENGKIIAQLKFTPAFATKDIKLGLSINSAKTKEIKNAVKNQVGSNAAVISFDQNGNFGMQVHVAVKIDLSKLNKKNLKFYSFDSKTDTVNLINPQPKYWIDNKGFSHIDTTIAGDIIISDK